MAKKDTSKTNVSARAAQKALQAAALCRFCGKKPEVVRVLTPAGRSQMFRKCCSTANIAA